MRTGTPVLTRANRHGGLKHTEERLKLVRDPAGRFFSAVAGHDEMGRANLDPGLDLFLFFLFRFFVLILVRAARGGAEECGEQKQAARMACARMELRIEAIILLRQ